MVAWATWVAVMRVRLCATLVQNEFAFSGNSLFHCLSQKMGITAAPTPFPYYWYRVTVGKAQDVAVNGRKQPIRPLHTTAGMCLFLSYNHHDARKSVRNSSGEDRRVPAKSKLLPVCSATSATRRNSKGVTGPAMTKSTTALSLGFGVVCAKPSRLPEHTGP